MKPLVNVLILLVIVLAALFVDPLAQRSAAQRRTPVPSATPTSPAVRIYEGTTPKTTAQKPAGGTSGQLRQLMPLDQLRYGDFTVWGLDGQELSLRSLLPAGQPALILFWQTSCELSQAEIPHLNKIWMRYHRQGLPVIALTIDDPAQRREVSAFVRNQRIEYPVYFPSPSLYRLMTGGATGTPQTYLFSRDGRISNRLIGWDFKRGPAQLEQAVLAVF